MAIPFNQFGTSNIQVSVLGFGAGQIGDASIPDKHVNSLLNKALDLGITLFDTARGYFLSEERIGKFLSHRRNEIVLSTKVGYGIPGKEDWTFDCVIEGVNLALRLLKTDYIDIVHLHSCNKSILEKGEVLEALLRTVEAGKVKIAAYSGENEDLEYALQMNVFKGIQCSINIADQRSIDNIIPGAKQNGLGVIGKRSIANAVWRFEEQPYGNYGEEYWLRWKKMSYKTDIEPEELFLRFSAFIPGISSALIGTTSIKHLERNAAIVNKGPLPEDIYNILRESFKSNDENWRGRN